MASRIVVRDVEAGYGAVRVLHGVSIEVRQGETVALLGTNGNGKSTLIKCIMGLVSPDAGEIFLETDGERIDLTSKSTEEIVGLGIAMVPEGRRLFPKLTVEENLLLGAYRPRRVETSHAISPSPTKPFPPSSAGAGSSRAA